MLFIIQTIFNVYIRVLQSLIKYLTEGGNIISYYNHFSTERNRLDSKIKSLQERLKSFPSGTLISARNGNSTNWYLHKPHNTFYLSKKKHHSLIEQMAYKKYLSLRLNELIHEKEAIDLYLQHLDFHPKSSEALLSTDSAYHEYLCSHFSPLSKELSDWCHAPYDKNTFHSEQLIHATFSGIMVRSKSEAMIEAILYKNHIPFRYECALSLGHTTYYPDFTIIHPTTRETIYWEHFGCIDKPDYRQDMIKKLRDYTANQIYPSINLITTYETQEHPLDVAQLERIFDFYFR